MSDTAIEWTERSWNPVVGCSIVSPGCTNCYAMKMAYRLEAMAPKPDGTGNIHLQHYVGTTTRGQLDNKPPVWTGKIAVAPESVLLEPLRRRKPTTYFVNSMGDLFHESVPDEAIDRVFAVMALAPQHTFQVLTKRAARMREYLTRPVAGAWAGRAFSIVEDGAKRDMTDVRMRLIGTVPDLFRVAPAASLNAAAAWQDKHHPNGDGFVRQWPLPNVWLGVSAEDQRRFEERVPELLATPAAIRFVSAEPLLGPIDARQWQYSYGCGCGWGGDSPLDYCVSCGWRGYAREAMGVVACPNCRQVITDYNACPECDGHDGDGMSFGPNHLPKLDWIIVGGESGQGARPMHPDWVRQIRDACAAAGTAFFFKQWGEYEECGPAWGAASGSAADLDGCSFISPDGRFHRLREDAPYGSWAVQRVGKKAAGRILDGVEHNAMPERRHG